MNKTESDRKSKNETAKQKVTPLGTDKKKNRNKPDDEPQEEFIEPDSNKFNTSKTKKK